MESGVCACTPDFATMPIPAPTASPAPALATAAPTTQAPVAYFPLVKGAYWVYEGSVKWQVGTETREKSLQWRMEVSDKAQRGDTSAFLVRGVPWDLAFYEEGKSPGDFTFLQVGQNKVYQGAAEDFARVLDPNDALENLVNENKVILDIPLVKGKKYCEAEAMKREDNLYCWVVNDSAPVQLDVKGVDAGQSLTEYQIGYATNADLTILNFVPGVGITRYRYIHHGSVSEVDVKLIAKAEE